MIVGIKNKFYICDAFGIPIYLDITFGFILLMFLFNAPTVYGISFALVLALSIVVHELAHALTARLFGYRTRDITLSLLGGCAALTALPRKGWQEFLTAAAGPLMSFAVSFASLLTLLFTRIDNVWLDTVIYYTYVLNLTLGLFNCLPALPMDGGRIFRSFLRIWFSRVKATYIAMIVGRVMAALLVVLPLFGIRYIGPIPIGGYFVIRLLIAWMIWQEGYREYRLAQIEGDFRRWTQEDFKARVSPPPYDR